MKFTLDNEGKSNEGRWIWKHFEYIMFLMILKEGHVIPPPKSLYRMHAQRLLKQILVSPQFSENQ